MKSTRHTQKETRLRLTMLTCGADLGVVEAVPLLVLEVLGDRCVVPRAETPRVFLRSRTSSSRNPGVSMLDFEEQCKRCTRRVYMKWRSGEIPRSAGQGCEGQIPEEEVEHHGYSLGIVAQRHLAEKKPQWRPE